MPSSQSDHALRIAVGYSEHEYFISACEIVNFLKNCNNMGLTTVTEITDQLATIEEMVISCDCQDAGQLKLALKLLREISYAMRCVIYEIPAG